MRTELKAYLVIGAVFAFGAVAGGAGAYAWSQRHYADLLRDDAPDVRENRRFGALVRQLDLTPEQQTKVHEIMRRHAQQRREAMRAVFDKCGGELLRARAEIDTDIRAVLTDTQRERYDRLMQERRPFMGMGPHRGRGPGWGRGRRPGPGR